MNLSELFIRRPVMTVLLNAAIIVAGVIAYGRIPVAALPSYNTPVINVSATLAGASPGIVWNCFSSCSATEVAIVSGLAPGSVAATLMTGVL